MSKTQISKANSVPVNSGVNSLRKLLTRKDYMSTPEYVDYCKEKLPWIRKKLPKTYVKVLQPILRANGFNYSNLYVMDCIRDQRDTYNIHVVKAAEAWIAENAPDPDQIVMVLPGETTSARRRTSNDGKSIAKRLGLRRLQPA